MATNQDNSSQGNLNQEDPIHGNGDRGYQELRAENQELKAKMGMMEAQVAEMTRLLLTSRNGGMNHSPLPPGPGASQLLNVPGNTNQILQSVQCPPYGLPLGFIPSTVAANPESGPSVTAELMQPTATVTNGNSGAPQIQIPNPVVIPDAPLGVPPPTVVIPQIQSPTMGNPNQLHTPQMNPAVVSMANPHYGANGFPQNYHADVPQARDKYQLLGERLRAVEGSGSRARNANELCLVPDVVIPPKFKVPDFDKYRGTTCPESHLTMYIRKMTAHKHDDKLLIHCFQDSLVEAPLEWYMQLKPTHIHCWRDLADAFVKQYQYSIGMAPDRIQLQNMVKKNKESFKEYAHRWRGLAAQVKPSLPEKEMASIFLNTLQAPFYDKLIVVPNFPDMVMIGERIESGIRNGKITPNLTGTSNASSFPTKKSEETNAIMKQRKSSQYTPIPMSYTDVCSYLISHNLITPRKMKPVQPPFPKGHNAKATCEFHAGAIGHSTENCHPLKQLVQGFIDAGRLIFEEDGVIRWR